MKGFERKKAMKKNCGMVWMAGVAFAMFGLSSAAAAATGTSPEFKLDLKEDCIRQSSGDETLTYSSQWDGDAGATVTIAQDGLAIADGLTGEGDRDGVKHQSVKCTETIGETTHGELR